MSTHTATPWCVLEGDTFGIVDDESRDIALDVCYEDDAAHIVKCVNEREEKEKALNLMLDAVDACMESREKYGIHGSHVDLAIYEAYEQARAILAKLDAQS